MTVTKTSNNTYQLKVYVPIDIRHKMGIKGNHIVKRYKTRREAKQAELDVLNQIHQLENGELNELPKMEIFSFLTSLKRSGGNPIRLDKLPQQTNHLHSRPFIILS